MAPRTQGKQLSPQHERAKGVSMSPRRSRSQVQKTAMLSNSVNSFFLEEDAVGAFRVGEEKSMLAFKASKDRLTLLVGLVQLVTLSGSQCSFAIPKMLGP